MKGGSSEYKKKSLWGGSGSDISIVTPPPRQCTITDHGNNAICMEIEKRPISERVHRLDRVLKFNPTISVRFDEQRQTLRLGSRGKEFTSPSVLGMELSSYHQSIVKVLD